MTRIQRNENNFQNKRKFTELPITIVTDDEHKTGDNLELTRQRIERAAIYIMSIFNLMKTAAITSEGQSESREMSGVFEDVINHCDIGYGIADSVMASASCLTEFQPDEFKTAEIKSDLLAAQISALLNNPNLPPPIYSGFANTMTDFFNEHVDENDFSDDANSPEYIARLLKSYGGKSNE